ncbi:MAG: NAD(P)-dependent oxidoreductase [Gammaproteobacteria bacterium]
MANLSGKTLFISGASRGIGREIALRAAKDGANIIIAAKTAEPHPKLPGTIHTVADEVVAVGGNAMAIELDIREDRQVTEAVEAAAQRFGGIDIVVNNASAINLTPVSATPMRRYDLMMDVNVRGTFCVTQACLPWLKKADNPHVLVLSPPINLDPKWFARHTAYTISKYGMSLCVLGMAEEFRADGIAVNALWPRTVIATAALAMLGGLVEPKNCRHPAIMADAAHAVLTRPSRECTGRFLIDDEVLAEAGITDLEKYAVKPGEKLLPDLFL